MVTQDGENWTCRAIPNDGYNVSTTKEYQERVLREQGLYQKPGEEVVTVLPLDEPEQKQQEEKVWWNPWTWFLRE